MIPEEEKVPATARSSAVHTWADIGLFKGALEGSQVKLAVFFATYMALYLILMVYVSRIWRESSLISFILSSQDGYTYFFIGFLIATVPVALGIVAVITASRKGFNQSLALSIGFGVPWLCIVILLLSFSPIRIFPYLFFSVLFLNAVLAFGFGLLLGLIFENRGRNIISGFYLGFSAVWLLQIVIDSVSRAVGWRYDLRLVLITNSWVVALIFLILGLIRLLVTFLIGPSEVTKEVKD